MGFSCCKCPKNDLIKTIVMEDPKSNNYINTDNKSNISEEKNKFPSQQSVTAFNQKINNQNNKKPEKVDLGSKNTDSIYNSIYEILEEDIVASRISEGNN